MLLAASLLHRKIIVISQTRYNSRSLISSSTGGVRGNLFYENLYENLVPKLYVHRML